MATGSLGDGEIEKMFKDTKLYINTFWRSNLRHCDYSQQY